MTRFMVSRRRLLAGASSILGLLAFNVPAHLTLAAPKQLPVYRLSPYSSASDPRCGGCTACRACRKHAENKYFASAAAADRGRAHPNCDCLIVAEVLPYRTWVALFGHPSALRRTSRDLRDPAVRAILKQPLRPRRNFLR